MSELKDVDTIDRALDKVLGEGVSAREALSVVSEKDTVPYKPSILVKVFCPVCNFSAVRNKQESTITTCMECGADAVVLENDGKESPNGLKVVRTISSPSPKEKLLGFLRPRDEFVFVAEVPFEDLELQTVYLMVPASRGKISWVDTRTTKAYSLDLLPSLYYKVKLLTEELLDVKRRFALGDRVKIKGLKEVGEVLDYSGQMYTVRVGEGDDMEEIKYPAMDMILIKKNETTRRYIKPSEGGYRLKFGRKDKQCVTYKEALVSLFEWNKTGFNRLSRIISDSPEEYPIDLPSIEFLRKVDKPIWTPVVVKHAQGYIR